MVKGLRRKNESIQKEQAELLIIQKELEDLLSKVNESTNTLKVEELQLKSSAVFSGIPSSSSMLSNKISNNPLQTFTTLSSLDLLNNASPKFSNWRQKSNPTESAIDQHFDLDLDTYKNRRFDYEEDDE